MIIEPSLGLGSVLEVPPPAGLLAKGRAVGTKPERRRAFESMDSCAVLERFDADAPSLSGGKRMEAAVGDERGYLDFNGATASQKAVAREGGVDPVVHPDSTLDQG